jgi:hypothetical protein
MAVETNSEKKIKSKLLPPPETVELPYVVETDCMTSTLGIEEAS